MQQKIKRIIPFRNAHYGEICNDFSYLLAKACVEELGLPEEHIIAMMKNIDPRASYQTVYRTLFSVASYAATVAGRGTSMMWFNVRAKNLVIKMREERFEFDLWHADGEGHLLAFPSKENEKYFTWI